MVTRKTFAVTVVLLVVMFGASDLVLLDVVQGPSAAQVKTQVDREIARRAAARDHEQARTAKVARDRFCALLSTVRRTPLTNGIRRTLHCQASTPLQKPGVAVTIEPSAPTSPSPHSSSHPRPTPRPRVTVTRTARPKPSPSDCAVEIKGTCIGVTLPFSG